MTTDAVAKDIWHPQQHAAAGIRLCTALVSRYTMNYDRIVIAYHGCDAATSRRLFDGEPFKKSQNDYDWLGEGIYFWEYGADRALRFAQDQRHRGKVKTPAVVGALIQLGRCFDLMDTRFTSELPVAFENFKQVQAMRGPAPKPRAARGQKPCLRGRRLPAHNTAMINDDANRPTLDPEAPGLDEETRRRRRALAKMQQASVEELFQIAVRAGIYTPAGELTEPYRNEEPSLYRPDLWTTG